MSRWYIGGWVSWVVGRRRLENNRRTYRGGVGELPAAQGPRSARGRGGGERGSGGSEHKKAHGTAQEGEEELFFAKGRGRRFLFRAVNGAQGRTMHRFVLVGGMCTCLVCVGGGEGVGGWNGAHEKDRQ